MKPKIILFILLVITSIAAKANILDNDSTKAGNFNIEKDLLLVQFDCKTDVDDLHTVAAFATLVSNQRYLKVNYHAVAGTYGTQGGLYVPPNDLFQLAFGDNWTDAHNNTKAAVEKVKSLVIKTLVQGGDLWIADAGQSDFSAELVNAIKKDLPKIETTKRIHIVQHAEWNEEVTTPEKLDFVKRNTDYIKIPDGNGIGNGTPGFRTPEFTNWDDKINNPELTEIWQLAVDLANKYNGKDGRYNNEAILAGGLDFSDLSEVCWILGLQDIKDVEHFFNIFSN
ncbi:hypothetical protein D2V08_11760 [Flagellimonas lutimaris]|jgi:hypothetical protein|uniref:DUF1593 domain-containing protein n=1 Tax=Flagellimonas lutimaris TaxID=475082 RepID=A0A3A1N623_9FLAO|nr:hypothetical protein [Allomuricauda lutimaris]RIV33076.1 hypothetical protein D2V08_11760 [Allomuricauda lutimaris]